MDYKSQIIYLSVWLTDCLTDSLTYSQGPEEKDGGPDKNKDLTILSGHPGYLLSRNMCVLLEKINLNDGSRR